MKVRSPKPKWVILMEGATISFLREASSGFFGFGALAEATRFESFAEAERYLGLKGVTWSWAVREDLVEEWKVMRALSKP